MKLYCQNIPWYVSIHQNQQELPWLLILHGFMGSGEVFQPLIGPLSKFCNPVTIDLLGHGRSGGSTDPARYQAERQIEDLDSILDRLQLRPLILHGYSMGGRLALQYAIRCPERFDLLILESTHAGISDPETREERRALDEKRAHAIQKNFDEFLAAWQRMPLFFETHPPSKHPTLYEKVMRNQNPDFLAASLRGFGSGIMPSVFKKLKNLKKPVCLLAGKEDQKYRSKMDSLHQKLPDSELNILSGAGHRVHMDQPEKFIHQIKMFTTKKIEP